MRTIKILDKDDVITVETFCRPLGVTYESSHSSAVLERATYSGMPINHMKWVPVRYVLGSCWIGKTVEEFSTDYDYSEYEYAIGDIPAAHILDMYKYDVLP
jgi:hypothetical protein